MKKFFVSQKTLENVFLMFSEKKNFEKVNFSRSNLDFQISVLWCFFMNLCTCINEPTWYRDLITRYSHGFPMSNPVQNCGKLMSTVYINIISEGFKIAIRGKKLSPSRNQKYSEKIPI